MDPGSLIVDSDEGENIPSDIIAADDACCCTPNRERSSVMEQLTAESRGGQSRAGQGRAG